MELRQLEYFIVVCQELNFVRASQKISISQQALSRSIQTLEEELGVPLFRRLPRVLELTEYGEVLLENVPNALSVLRNAVRRIEQMKQNEKNLLRFAFTDGVEDFQKLGGFSTLYPEYQLSSVAMTDRQIEKALLAGQIDFAISSAIGTSQSLNYKVLHTFRSFLLVDDGNPLEQKEVLTIPDLRGQNIIFAPSEYNVGARFDELCRQAGFAPRIMHQTGNLNYIAQLVMTHQGVFLCPESIKGFFDQIGLHAIPLATDQPLFSVCFVTRKGIALPKSIQLFEEFYTGLSEQHERHEEFSAPSAGSEV